MRKLAKMIKISFLRTLEINYMVVATREYFLKRNSWDILWKIARPWNILTFPRPILWFRSTAALKYNNSHWWWRLATIGERNKAGVFHIIPPNCQFRPAWWSPTKTIFASCLYLIWLCQCESFFTQEHLSKCNYRPLLSFMAAWGTG